MFLSSSHNFIYFLFIVKYRHQHDKRAGIPRLNQALKRGKGKGFPYSIPSVGPGADPGVQAVSLQVTVSHPPGGRLPLLSARPAVTPQPQSITALWPVPSYTAW